MSWPKRREALLSSSASSRSSSSGTTRPLGLCGEFNRTTRVRGVMAASMRTRSSLQSGISKRTLTGTPSAAPTVVLEAGMASMSANWAWVQRALTPDFRVVSYDRAGLGWSEPGTGRPDAAFSAAERHTALGAAGCRPPYVTVAGATHYTLVSEQRYAAVVSDAVRTVSARRSDGIVQ